MKLLLGVPSPFDFKLVEKHQKHLQVDMIKPMYYEEVEAYSIIRDYFLKHSEYTHLVIACSDIVVNQAHIDQLIKDLQEKEYDVISGMMNICLEYLDVYNVTSNVVYPLAPEFMWYTESTLPKEDIFEVKWSGFPLMCLSRKIVEQYEFEPLSSIIPDERLKGSLDVVLCWKLHQDGIKIFCDKRIKLLHLKEIQEESQPLLVGIKKPRIEYSNLLS